VLPVIPAGKVQILLVTGNGHLAVSSVRAS
jgi:hypothetical protein